MQQPARRLCGTSRHTSTRTLDIERPSPAEGGIPIPPTVITRAGIPNG